MLELRIKTDEEYNEETQEFSSVDVTLHLEHSLFTVSKWESFYEKPFYGKTEKTPEELLAYICMMETTSGISDDVLKALSRADLEAINDYITSKQTATWFAEHQKNQSPGNEEVITAELMYYWMISYQIPMECERWHLNKLFTLIRVFNVKNQKPKKMSPAEIARRNHELNAKRRNELNTQG